MTVFYQKTLYVILIAIGIRQCIGDQIIAHKMLDFLNAADYTRCDQECGICLGISLNISPFSGLLSSTKQRI